MVISNSLAYSAFFDKPFRPATVSISEQFRITKHILSRMHCNGLYDGTAILAITFRISINS